MLLYIMRHGETDYNVDGKIQGWVDTELNENGKKFGRLTAEGGMKDIPFDLVISSTLKRAIQSARLAIGERDIPFVYEPRIRERRSDEWDGFTNEELAAQGYANEIELFWNEPMKFQGAPKDENMHDVIARTGEFFEELIHNPEYQDKTILIATHGCAMRGIMYSLYEDKEDYWRGSVPLNYAVSILQVEDGNVTILEDNKVYYDRSLVEDHYAFIK